MLTEQFQAPVSLAEPRTVVSCMWSLAKSVGLQGSLPRPSVQRSVALWLTSTLHQSAPPCDRQAEHAGYEVKEIEVLVQVDSIFVMWTYFIVSTGKISTLCYIWKFGWSVYKSIMPSKFICFNVGSGQVLNPIALHLSLQLFDKACNSCL